MTRLSITTTLNQLAITTFIFVEKLLKDLSNFVGAERAVQNENKRNSATESITSQRSVTVSKASRRHRHDRSTESR